MRHATGHGSRGAGQLPAAAESSGASADAFIKRSFRIDPARIALLRFLAEGYDGLLFVRTLDPRPALVEIAYPPSQRQAAEALVLALIERCELREDEPLPGEEIILPKGNKELYILTSFTW